MPLINITTDLKNLGYGDDKPHVTKDINNPPNYNSISKEVTARKDDVVRITKMFASANGIRFAAHEALLNSGGAESRIKKSREEGKTLAGALLKEAGRAVFSTGKTVASLIAQTGVAGTGEHIIRGFEPASRYLDDNNAQSALESLIGDILPEGLGVLDPGRGGSLLKIEGSSVLQDNRGEGYTAPVESGLTRRESLDELKDINPYTGHTGKTDTSVSAVNSILKDQATEVNVIDDSYTGFEGSTNSAVWRVETALTKEESELDLEKDPAGTKASTKSSLLGQAQKVSSIPRSGYALSQIRQDQFVTVTEKQIKDKDGNLVTVRDTKGVPMVPSMLKSFLDASPNQDGETTLPKSVQDTVGTVESGEEGDQLVLKNYSVGTEEGITDKEFVVASQTDGKGSRSTTLIDFRRVRKAPLNLGVAKYNGFELEDHENGFNTKTTKLWEQSDSIDRKYGTGNPGIVRAYYDPTDTNDDKQELRVDKINLLDVGQSPEDGGFKDMIPFKIVSVVPDLKTVAETPLYFRAFLDNLSDNFNGEWSSYSYIGRGDKVYAYDGFERSIEFGFKAAAMSKEELIPIYNKLNHLASITAPTYADSRFMRGTYARVTIGDYLADVPGVITSVGFTWDVNTPWEIDSYDEGLLIVPHMLSVSVQMKAIHDFTPTTALGGSPNKFIGLNKTPKTIQKTI